MSFHTPLNQIILLCLNCLTLFYHFTVLQNKSTTSKEIILNNNNNNNNRPWGLGKTISRVAIIYYLKCLVFKEKLWKLEETRNSDLHTGRKVDNKNSLWESPGVKHFKAYIINMLQELKETMTKEIKEWITRSHMKENIKVEINIFKNGPNGNFRIEKYNN